MAPRPPRSIVAIRSEWNACEGSQKGQYRLGHAEVGLLLQSFDGAMHDYHRWHKAFIDAKYPDMLPTRQGLEEAIEWACQWVPNPVECSPVPSNEVIKIIHGFVLAGSQADGGRETACEPK